MRGVCSPGLPALSLTVAVRPMAAIGQCLKICRRNSNTPAAVRLHCCLIGLRGRAVKRYRNNLPRFSGGATAHRHARIGFAGVDDIVAGDGIDNDGWRAAIDAVVMHRRGILPLILLTLACAGAALR